MNKMTPLAENLLKKSTGFRNKADLYQATRFLHEIGMFSHINSLHTGKFSCFFCYFSFQNQLFKKNISEIPSECQTV